MYNETIYNVFISPQIQNKFFRKRNMYINLLEISTLLAISMIVIQLLDIIGIITEEVQWINSTTFILLILIVIYGLYVVKYNPVKNYHISLQIYYNLLFLQFFYFDSGEYPFGFVAKLKYMIIVQTCIDAIDKFIKVMEEFLISSENTIARITYMRDLRDLLYKMKRKKFFETNIDDFKVILDDFYSSTHKGLNAIFEFSNNIDYLDNFNIDSRDEVCKKLLHANSKETKSEIESHKSKTSDRRYRITISIIIVITSILVATNIFVSNEIWARIIMILGVIVNVVTLVKGLLPNNVR